MTGVKPILVLAALLCVSLAGCVEQPDDATPASTNGGLEFEPCVHPWPCGDGTEWPLDLEGPFDLDRVEHVFLEMEDGVKLEGWVGVPALPDGVKAPTLFHYTPYLSLVKPPLLIGSPADDGYWRGEDTGVPPGRDSFETFFVPLTDLIGSGYTVALFSVRGTAGSEGCLTLNGQQESDDAVVILDWLAEQSWSNGRIGMGGASYPGATQIQAAQSNHPALKTIVPAVPNLDWSANTRTPQGLPLAVFSAKVPSALQVATSPLRPIEDRGMPVTDPASRLCPELRDATVAEDTAFQTGQRPTEFFLERALTSAFEDVSASVFYAGGYYDWAQGGLMDDEIWQFMESPSRMMLGPWIHSYPTEDPLSAFQDSCPVDSEPVAPWSQYVMPWYDYWLKGIGDPAGPDSPVRIGVVDFQDGCGVWNEDTQWPPAASHNEALYLTDDGLVPSPTEHEAGFLSAPSPFQPEFSAMYPERPREDTLQAQNSVAEQGWLGWCQPGPAELGGGLRYATEPVTERTLIAGNPHMWLQLSTDQPHGSFFVELLALPANLQCADPANERPPRILSAGGADVRFHEGSMAAQTWQPNTPTNVRVDMWSNAVWLEEGERLALAITYGEVDDFESSYSRVVGNDPATITIHGDGAIESSHLVVPVAEGTFGGNDAGLEYPGRPILGHNFSD